MGMAKISKPKFGIATTHQNIYISNSRNKFFEVIKRYDFCILQCHSQTKKKFIFYLRVFLICHFIIFLRRKNQATRKKFSLFILEKKNERFIVLIKFPPYVT